MRICFVDPRGIHFGLNTGIGYLVSSLKAAGFHGIKVFDFNNNGDDIASRVQEIREYDAIGFSIKSFTRESALEIAHRVKTGRNRLFAGGPHISLDGANFLREHPVFDAGFKGEGERTTVSWLRALQSGGDLSGIQGLVFRRGGDLVDTGPSERILDPDTLPFPDYADFDSLSDGRIHNYPLVTSRGCPFLCTYCCVRGVMGRKWVPRTIPDVLAELEEARRSYGIRCFNIQDDNFSLDMERARRFCDGLVDRSIAMDWSCPNGIRADRVDDDLMGRMRRSGCFNVAMGIESGVEEEFNSVKKGETLGDIMRAVELADRHGIHVSGNFIIGLPHSSLASIRESIRFAKRMNLESCIFNLLVPFPGTEVWDWVQRNGRMLMDWKDGFTQGKNPRVVFETDDFPRGERVLAYFEANVRCRNYFALMDEHEGVLRNVLSVLLGILRYDWRDLPGHVSWCFRHSKRILARIVEKNA